MAIAYTKGDTLGIYRTATGLTGTYNLGGRKDGREIVPNFFVGPVQIPPIVILSASGNNTTEGYLAAKSASTLSFIGTGGTEGSAVTCNARDTVLVEDTDNDLWIRVYRDTDYSTADLGGFFNLTFLPEIHGVIGGAIVTKSGSVQNHYGAVMLSNHSGLGEACSSIKAWIGTLGTQRLSGTAQLGGAGGGTITTATADGFADWPASGWCRITTNAPALREIVYYSSRTSTSLTVPADGRGRLGTSAAAGAATDSVDCVPGIRIGYEAMDSNGEIQAIASATTAPTGITWDTDITSALGLSIGTLNPRENVGLWIHREIPANVTASILMENKINLSYVVDGVTYTNVLRGNYRIKDTSLALVKLWLGVDADPDFTTAPDATAALFPSIVITPPVSGISEYRIGCKYTNEYGITSHDTGYQSIWVNSSGAQVDAPITSPVDVSLENRQAGVAILQAKYRKTLDSTPADTWRIYYRTNGTDPDPAIDTPIEILLTDSTYSFPSQFDNSMQLRYAFATQAYNTDLRVIVRMYNSDTTDESINETVTQLTINTSTQSISPIPQAFAMMKESYSGQRIGTELSTLDLGNSWRYRIFPDEFLLYTGSTVVMRSTIKEYAEGRIYVPATFSFDNVAHSAAAVSTTYLIEAVSANVAYILVGSTRRAKIDLSTNVIEAAEFDWGAGISEDIPVNAFAWGNSSATYLLQYSPIRGRFVPWLKLTSGGVLSTMFPVTQRRS